jgi:hypothetical protein
MIVCSVADKNETRTLPDLPIAARATGRPCGGALSAGVDGGRIKRRSAAGQYDLTPD